MISIIIISSINANELWGNSSESLEIRDAFNDERNRGQLSIERDNTLIIKEKEHVSKFKG